MPQITDRFKGASTARQKHLQAGRTAPAPKKSTGTRPSARSIRAEAEKRNANRAEAEKRNANRAASKKVTDGMTKDERAEFNGNEGEAARDAASDPSTSQMYQNATQLSTLDPTKREQTLDFLREMADEEFFDHFERRRQAVVTDAKFAMETIAQQFGELNEETKRELGQAIEKLDHDSAKELQATFTAAIQRGLMGTGVMKILAQRIIDDEKFSAKQLQEDLDADLRFSAEKQALQEKGVGIDKAAALSGIEDDRVEAVEIDMFQRAGFEDMFELLRAIDSGAFEMDPVTGEFRDTRTDEQKNVVDTTATEVPTPEQQATDTQQARDIPSAPETSFDATPEAIETRSQAVRARNLSQPVERTTLGDVQQDSASKEIQEKEAEKAEGKALQSAAEIRRRARLERNSQQL